MLHSNSIYSQLPGISSVWLVVDWLTWFAAWLLPVCCFKRGPYATQNGLQFPDYGLMTVILLPLPLERCDGKHERPPLVFSLIFLNEGKRANVF